MDTLVLDPGYQPVARVTWMRAITLIWAGKVEVVEEYQDWTVHSVTVELAVPSVVRFIRGVRAHRQHVRFSREQVFARDGGRCQYCLRALTRPTATYDHVIPRMQGGRTCWENIVIACVRCNQRKGGRTPQEARMVLARAPVKPAQMTQGVRITFDPGMPVTWRAWLRDHQYWNGELEQDS
jgi:5-methylcytosine-specific restriction endonuclease McrA